MTPKTPKKRVASLRKHLLTKPVYSNKRFFGILLSHIFYLHNFTLLFIVSNERLRVFGHRSPFPLPSQRSPGPVDRDFAFRTSRRSKSEFRFKVKSGYQPTMTQRNSVQQFYVGKTIFITGGSGFMGKVLIEKLLYSCSDVKELIVLMRPKRGKSATQRVEDFTKLPVSQSFAKHIMKIFPLRFATLININLHTRCSSVS